MRRIALAGAAALLIAAAFLFLQAPGEPGVFMRDFEVYWSAGRAVIAHADPYTLALQRYEFDVPGVRGTTNEFLPFIGAPPTLLFWSAFGRVNYDTAAGAWAVILSAAFACLIYCSARFSHQNTRMAGLASALLCALAFVPITSDFELGQPALVAGAAAALAVLAASRSALGVSLCAMAGTLQPNVALPSLVGFEKRRGAVGLLAAAIVLYILGAVIAGTNWPLRYFSLLQAHGAAERFDTIQYTPASIAFGFGAPAPIANASATLVAICALFLAIVAIIRAHNIAQRFVIASAAVPLVTGFTHEHDLLLLFIPSLWALRHVNEKLRPFALCAFSLLAVNWMDFAQQPHAAAQDLTLGTAAIFAGLAWCERRTPALYAAAFASFSCICFGAWLGAHHPAPIWPNDMRGFSIPANPTAAGVWHAEQLATGLERVEPAWALLRSFALAGSLLLLAVICGYRRRNNLSS